MKIIIQKFGGTSVQNSETRQYAHKHIQNAIKQGYKVVVVVSAMGRTGAPYATDTLLSLVGGSNTLLNKREQDLLLSCGETISSVVFTNELLAKGLKATALTGAQAGFITTNDHTNAKINEMNCKRLLKQLESMDVVVVAGFQGATKDGDVTTIGRGGSDTSAAALGAALNAEWIDIYTDVDGMMTADPRLVKKARSLSSVTYNEVSNMAYEGAKVIHPRAVEIAMHAKIPIRIKSTYTDSPGTLVTSLDAQAEKFDVKERLVTGIAYVPNVSQIKVKASKGEYNLQSDVFKAMANEGISIDFINISPNNVIYTVPSTVLQKAVTALGQIGYTPTVERNCAKVSVVGAGITGVPGVTAKIVAALSDKEIKILQSADSHTTIWVLVNGDDLVNAVNALHDAFELQNEEVQYER
ncbi:aspartate kinase [Lederbergia galactosidilytica]|uniref:Aspartokinase n=1 Tax=Lederbergia galactosidilytica TaxID=217031 RepID=A0A177ZYE0_9BACI|nr:aspartate kinase [Lederbergia galactosidilytica]KRG09632.1 aspartate kinase [Virgibacillus soli]OAK72509.1 aspartate kinase [Lederbergia galactosidilytica]